MSALPVAWAMSLILPSTAPKAWGDAVRRSARICVATGKEGFNALAFVLYTLAAEQRVGVDAVSMDDVRAALRNPDLHRGDEPTRLRARIQTILEAQGQYHFSLSPARDVETALWRIYREVGHRESYEDWTGIPPSTSELGRQVAALRDEFVMTDEEAAVLPHVPDPVGPVVLRITGQAKISFRSVSAESVVAVRCPPCKRPRMSVELRVDGPEVTFMCQDGHTSRDANPSLTALRVRNALVHHPGPERIPWESEGTVVIDGDLLVAHKGMRENVNPYSDHSRLTFRPEADSR
ncbi:hypothetical protein [Streptomyces microflavus]|uniref:hypothetical protein n=1 Tax=Streptomyces microflavus TaxID=1919 RepID=UPI00382BE612